MTNKSTIFIESKKPRRYSLQDLIDPCDPAALPPPVDLEWLDIPSAGSELP